MENSWFIRFTGSWLGVDISLALQENDPQLSWTGTHAIQLGPNCHDDWEVPFTHLHTSSHCFHHLPSLWPSFIESAPLPAVHTTCPPFQRCRREVERLWKLVVQLDLGIHAASAYCGCVRETKSVAWNMMGKLWKTHTFQSAPQECQSLEIGSMWHKQRQGHLLQPQGLFLSSRTAPLAEVKVRTLKYFKHLTPDPG